MRVCFEIFMRFLSVRFCVEERRKERSVFDACLSFLLLEFALRDPKKNERTHFVSFFDERKKPATPNFGQLFSGQLPL